MPRFGSASVIAWSSVVELSSVGQGSWSGIVVVLVLSNHQLMIQKKVKEFTCYFRPGQENEVRRRAHTEMATGAKPVRDGRPAMLVGDVLEAKGRRVISIGPEATVEEALGLFVEHNIGALPVAAAGGQLVGIFTERDVILGDHHDSSGSIASAIEEV